MKTKNVKNSFTILRDYMLDTWEFRYNCVRNEIEYKLRDDEEYVLLNDADVYVHLRENNVPFKKEDFMTILRSSIMQRYNPIKRYYENLSPWDLKTDHISNYISYLSYNGSLDIKKHFEKWLIRCVKCAIEEKYFNKQIFVLVGGQNDGKSTYLRYLVPNLLEKYYCENPDFKSKDGEIALSQNFIINMDELANIGREDTSKLKTFISKHSINLRRPYEKNTKPESRKTSFVGSTNNDEFLVDHTGNVRWLIFKIDGINFNYSKEININDVWAQAYYLYKNNFEYEITKEELKEIEESNEEFKIQSQEMQVIKEYIAKPNQIDLDTDNFEFVTATDIINYLEQINPKYRTLNVNRMGYAMTSLGYKKVSKRKPGSSHPTKGYLITKMKQ